MEKMVNVYLVKTTSILIKNLRAVFKKCVMPRHKSLISKVNANYVVIMHIQVKLENHAYQILVLRQINLV